MPNTLFQIAMSALVLASSVGSGLAFRSHNSYLGARLLALSVAALPAAIYSKRYLAVIAAQSRTTFIVGSIVGLILVALLVMALFPRAIFGYLGGLAKH
jgi:hypothetical protein